MSRNKESVAIWRGEHHGVAWEVHRWEAFDFMKEQTGREWNWSYYLFIHLDRLPEEVRESFWLPPHKWGIRKNHVGYDYHDSPIAALNWHGGCTFYQKHGGIDDIPRVVQVGCDFQHYGDGDYSLQNVIDEALDSVAAFREQFPGYKYWCRWDGKLHDPKEVVASESGYKCCEGRKEP